MCSSDLSTHMCDGRDVDDEDVEDKHRQLTSDFIAYGLSNTISALPSTGPAMPRWQMCSAPRRGAILQKVAPQRQALRERVRFEIYSQNRLFSAEVCQRGYFRQFSRKILSIQFLTLFSLNRTDHIVDGLNKASISFDPTATRPHDASTPRAVSCPYLYPCPAGSRTC